MRRALLLALLAALLVTARASVGLADAPLPPPELKTLWSASRAWCAVMEPRAGITTVYRVEAGDRRTVSWAMMGWHRVAWLSDDGVHLVVGHPGVNLLPTDARESDVLLYFVERGALVGTVRLGEVVPLVALKRTASHLLWGSYEGLDAQGRLVLRTVQERVLRFDPSTGRRVP